jgi:hypothetical protein
MVTPRAEGWGKRKDLLFTNGELTLLHSGRRMHQDSRDGVAGTDWVVFSKIGSFMAYRANGVLYRSRLDGSALKEFITQKPLKLSPNERDGILLSDQVIYDVETDRFVATAF